MKIQWIAPLAAAASLVVAWPVWAHGHQPTNRPAPAQTTAPVLPTGASNVPASAGVTPSTTPGAPHTPPVSHPHPGGKSATVQSEVQQLHALQQKVQAARQAYVAAIRQYLKTLSSSLAGGQTGTLQTAVQQLKVINTTLAQAVKTEHAAQSSPGGGLTQVLAKFQAELTALTTATNQVEALTANLGQGAAGGSPSTSPSAPPTTSASGT
ncbi:MAG: hypothetical protein OWQ57_12535 [Sulfobacillus sp.]|nr:hypothetical protein [Sulfobacillus sp.]